MIVLLVLGLADGSPPFSLPLFLREFDPEAHGGLGAIDLTNDPLRAKRFASSEEAAAEWKRIPESKPLRRDNKPNRPLTAFSVQILDIPEAGLREPPAVI